MAVVVTLTEYLQNAVTELRDETKIVKPGAALSLKGQLIAEGIARWTDALADHVETMVKLHAEALHEHQTDHHGDKIYWSGRSVGLGLVLRDLATLVAAVTGRELP